jgi:hypothetical protein
MSTAERALPILLCGALLCAVAASCGQLAPLEPLPGQTPASAADSGAAGAAPPENETSNGGAPTSHDGAPQADAGAPDLGGQSGAMSGAAGGPVEPRGSAGETGECGPEVILDITDRSDSGAEILQAHTRNLELRIRGSASAVRLNANAYRVFALDTSSHVVYADVPRDREAISPPQWLTLGGDYYVFHGSPTAVAQSETRMWVFAVGFIYSDLYQSGWDGVSWSEPLSAGTQLLGNPAAVATGLGNLLIAGRCQNSGVCLTRQPLETLAQLQPSHWMRLEVATDHQPAAVERADGVHVAVTTRGGAVMHGQLRPGKSEFQWTRLEGMCFRSAPTLVSRTLSLDVFGQGMDGALYWQSRVGERWQGWVKLSRIFGSAPLVVSDGADGLLVATTDDQGYLWIRRFANGLWAAWVSFAGYGAGVADQPFPGSGLVLGQGDIRLLLQDFTSNLTELALTR